MSLELLAKALQMPTVSYSDYSRIDLGLHQQFLEFLRDTFPLLHQHGSPRYFDEFGVVFRIPGKGKGKPVLALAHYDVVPAEPQGWTHPPFGGVIQDDVLYGRGAADDKHSLMAWAIAAEELLNEGWAPERDVYLAFGGDEEVQGFRGASQIAKHFANEGLRFEWIWDEGSPVADGFLPGATTPLALVSTSEKGFLNLALTVNTGQQGHSGWPPKHTPLGILARAISKLEANLPRPRLIPQVREFLKTLAPSMEGAQKVVLGNLWLTAPLVARLFDRETQTAAMLRTTYAPTMAQGSTKENVLPGKASAVVNCRILPGETVDATLVRARSVIGDERVTVENLHPEESSEPAAASSTTGPGFSLIRDLVAEFYPGVPTLPYMFIATTDSRHYRHLSEQVLRFIPMRTTPEELAGVHGKDERISRHQFDTIKDFYRAALKRS